ncbi:MAG: hypothetical protein LQ343_007942 [Gyalolechia ehrenbergii]|nr:MAG: hypothetical protein LQ343_007942 [Gyalolechia ehrenbergii]
MRASLAQIAARIFQRARGQAPSVTKPISISCRGKPITEEELFAYTNGHFLVDEKHQLQRRYIKFNLQKLCDVVSSVAANGSPVCKVDKFEGGFSKALLMTTADGMEVVAKIPGPTAGRAMYSTASEAAVLSYVKSHTSIPVPKILAWNADSSNPVGAEYIIMEKAAGIQLFKVWADIPMDHRIQLIENLIEFERQLASIGFPAYGSLYFRQSITKTSERSLLDSSVDPTESFCIGPQCGPAWTNGNTCSDVQSHLNAGPWSGLPQFGMGLVQRSFARTNLPMPRDAIPLLHGTQQVHEEVLKSAIKILPFVCESPVLLKQSKPTLWHTDLHMGNIFVSAEDHSRITCFIDWQHTSISPLFMQVRWPIFLEPPEGYEEGTKIPQLHPDFEKLDADGKETALADKTQATCAKTYELTTCYKNREAYSAKWRLNEVFRELFVRLGRTWEDGAVPLRECLSMIARLWTELGFLDPCPLTFTPKELESLEHQLSEYYKFHEVRTFAKKYLQTDDEGWIAPQLDFAERQAANKALLNLAIDRCEGQKTPNEVRSMWPFPP